MANSTQTKLRNNPGIQTMPKSDREWTHFVNELSNILGAIFDIVDSLPVYAPSNDATDRTWDANAAAGSITSPPTQGEVENIRDSVLELSDVVATLATDLQDKNILG